MEQSLLEIINVVLSNAGLSTIENLELSANLRDELKLDSINLAELTVRIDEKFGIDVFDDGTVETVGEIIQKLKA